MPRAKKSAVGRGRPKGVRQVNVAESNDDEPASAPVAGHDDAVTSADAEVQPRDYRSYVDFWKGLNYKPLRLQQDAPKHRSARSHRSKDQGQVSEKYRLQTGPSSKRVLLLQYPDKRRSELASLHRTQQPGEIRLKPKSGVVEVDIPIPSNENCDREKSIAFGSAWRRSNALHQNGAHGLAGGFGVGSRKFAPGEDAVQVDGSSRAAMLEESETSASGDLAMNKFTLGGRIVALKEGDPIYMVATFSGTACKWTKVDAIVQLRPQFHHLDALNEEARHAASSMNARSEDKARAKRAEDVNMMVKDSADIDNGDMYGGMNDTAKLLREMQNEPWRTLKWQGFLQKSDEASVTAYDRTLNPIPNDEGPYLISEMTSQQYLDAVSCPRIDPTRQGEQISLAMSPTGNIHGVSTDDQHESKADDGDDHVANGDGNDLDGADVEMRDDAPTSLNGFQSAHMDIDGQTTDDPHPQAEATTASLIDETGQQSTFPESASRPDAKTERLIEQICRIICIAPPHRASELERKLCARYNGTDSGNDGDRRYAFLRPEHEYHAFFRWRLRRNQVDEGIPPEEDNGVS